MRVFRNRNVTSQLRAITAVHYRHIGITNGLEIAIFDRGFDTLDIKHHNPVAVVAHGAGQIHRFLRVVAGGSGVLASVIGVGIIQVAIHDHLPGHIHGVRINGSKHGVAVFQAIVAAVVRVWNHKFRVAEYILGARYLLQPQSVNGLYVRNVGDLVRLHDVQTDTGNTAVGLVVDEQVFAIVAPVLHGDVWVVTVTVQILLVTTQNFLTFVGNTPAGRRVHIEYRDAHQLTHGRHTQNTNLALVTTAPEAVVFVQLTRRNVVLVFGFLDRSSPGLPRHDRAAQPCCAHGARQSGCPEEFTATQTVFFRCLFAKFVSLFHNVQLRCR